MKNHFAVRILPIIEKIVRTVIATPILQVGLDQKVGIPKFFTMMELVIWPKLFVVNAKAAM